MEKFSYLNRSNLEYVETLYQNFRRDPESIGPEWRMFFDGVEFAQNLTATEGLSSKEFDVFRLINAYRDYGHFGANLNPLAQGTKSYSDLTLNKYNLSDADLDTTFQIGALVGKPNSKLREILQHLRDSYCGTITVQARESASTIRDWFIDEFEGKRQAFQLSSDVRKQIFQQLVNTEAFERFLHTRYVGKKRFSIEGCDALIPMLHHLAMRGSEIALEEIVIGMAHRGRLNVLVNFMDKGVDSIFGEFEGIRDEHNSFFDGDVKYHLGHSADKATPNGKVHLSLAFNPSHLEAVDPVALGMVRAKQRRRKDTAERKKVVPVLIHGDAAFAGQGVVTETLQLSQLKGYTVGGTIHVVLDNQVGFTTDPDCSRSSPYASDVAKILQMPVVLANGDDVESCVRAMDIAIRFRQEFKQDIVVVVVGYRRFGHNEGDEPAFTQPLLYDRIKKHPTLYKIYSEKLVKDGVMTAEETEAAFKGQIEKLQKVLDQVKKNPPSMKPLAFEGLWKGLRGSRPEDFKVTTETKVTPSTLKKVTDKIVNLPESFKAHPKLLKLLEQRAAMTEGKGSVDWGMGELLCYGSLMYEGIPVRLTGQDVQRGTFTHRHAVYSDVATGEKYSPLATIDPGKVEFCIYNSPLSEYAVLGYEYGNSSTDPTYLTIWEAQFGDFANGAQIIIDQFIASAEQKWQRMSGLVLLLPHGYEGQGPEHSSARLERFLQLCAQNNMQVVNLTTPAQLFHCLRRQVKREFRVPLIVMSPKSLLRHPKVISTVDEFTKGHFEEVLPDVDADKKKVETVVLCSGKIYYHILDGREEAEASATERTAIVRVEQLYPFPDHKISQVLKSYPNLKRVIWTQEEPKNMGAWYFVYPRLLDLVGEQGLAVEVEFNGRTERASPATGSEKVHNQEQKTIVQNCFASGGSHKVKSSRSEKAPVAKERGKKK